MNMENLYTVDCIRTRSGIYVNVFDPKPEMFIIEDIAHALGQIPRYAGHLKHHYSVAQHSIYVSNMVKPKHRLQALMHDASEAFLLDIPSPIKARLDNYKTIEEGLMKVIAQKFGFEWPMDDEVKFADKQMLEMEWEILMLEQGKEQLQEMLPASASIKFLQVFNKITGS